ncbi:MAG TPA: HEAT repeat domain-containing protein [Kofleriaceae bacterium]|nr:HEAT repeat domain-containing protein [Kofleriaceae bacterium]
MTTNALRALGIVLAILVGITPARAEQRVAELTHMMASSSAKTRLSAVLALAKLGDRAAQKPLVAALKDPSERVRAVAATALGRLGCEAALPALRVLASEDAVDDVRKAASTAAMKIAMSHPSEGRTAKPDGEAQARRMPPAVAAAVRPGMAASHQAEPHAGLYLLVSSAADESPGAADKLTRKAHAEIIKRVLVEQLRNEASVTSSAEEARRWGLDARHIDLSVTRLDLVRTGGMVEIEAELRIALSDDSGKMMSFLTGGAKVQVPSGKFDAKYLPSLRNEALENAMRGMFGKLLAHLREQPSR